MTASSDSIPRVTSGEEALRPIAALNWNRRVRPAQPPAGCGQKGVTDDEALCRRTHAGGLRSGRHRQGRSGLEQFLWFLSRCTPVPYATRAEGDKRTAASRLSRRLAAAEQSFSGDDRLAVLLADFSETSSSHRGTASTGRCLGRWGRADAAIGAARRGRCVLSAERFDTNLRRCGGPEQVTRRVQVRDVPCQRCRPVRAWGWSRACGAYALIRVRATRGAGRLPCPRGASKRLKRIATGNAADRVANVLHTRVNVLGRESSFSMVGGGTFQDLALAESSSSSLALPVKSLADEPVGY